MMKSLPFSFFPSLFLFFDTHSIGGETKIPTTLMFLEKPLSLTDHHPRHLNHITETANVS